MSESHFFGVDKKGGIDRGLCSNNGKLSFEKTRSVTEEGLSERPEMTKGK